MAALDSGLSFTDLGYANSGDFAALLSFTAEATLLGAGVKTQPKIPANWWGPRGQGRTARIIFGGVLSTTGTPTYTFRVRLGTTQGSSFLTGTVVALSAAIVTTSGAANTQFMGQVDLTCQTAGAGTSNCTLSCRGTIVSFGGFASPFGYTMTPGGGESATWTTTLDAALDQWVNPTVVCSASSASNTLTLKTLLLVGWN